MVAFLEGLEGGHEVVATGDTVGNDTFRDAGGDGALDDRGHRIHGPHDLGLELGRNVELDLLEQVLGRTKATNHEDVLEGAVLGLDSDDLVADELEDAVDDRLEALQNFLVSESHVTFFNACLRELGLDTNINSPLLSVVPEVGLDSVLEVHDALGVHASGGLGAIGRLHLANLGPEDVAEVPVERGRTARVAGSGCALSDCERILVLDLVGDQIDRATTAIDNQDGVVHLQVQKTRLGAEQRGGLGLADEGQSVVVLIPRKPAWIAAALVAAFPASFQMAGTVK